MTGKEFTRQARELGATVKKTDSKYWGKVWWQATFQSTVVSLEIHFEENKPATCRVLGKNDNFVSAMELRQSVSLYENVAAFLTLVNG